MAQASTNFRLIQVGWAFGDTMVKQGEDEVTRLCFGEGRKAGRFAFDGADYLVARPSVVRDVLRLESQGRLLCETAIDGGWSKTARLSMDGAAYLLSFRQFDGRTILKLGETEVGVVDKWKPWKRGCDAIFLTSVPPALRMFVMWLAVYRAQKDASNPTTQPV